MNSIDAILQFGEEVRIPKTADNGFLLSSDGVFYTLSGEGRSIGQPAIFVRLHMCNLRCDFREAGGGLCDTSYTWNTDSKEYWTFHSFITFEDTVKEIQKYPCKRVVFSGGEPLIQQDQIVEFMQGYLDPSCIVEIETNGTIMPSVELRHSCENIWFNCSPKLSSAGMERKDRIKPEVLRCINNQPSSIFKFVVTRNEDLVEIEDIIQECDLWAEKIVLMPEGIDSMTLTKRMQELAEVVKAKRWSLTPRLQIFIWGNKRGT